MKGAFSAWGDSARRYVRYAQGVLKEYKIDIDSIGENVHWAPNKGHSIAYAKAVADRLKAIRRAGGSRDRIVQELESIATLLRSGDFPT